MAGHKRAWWYARSGPETPPAAWSVPPLRADLKVSLVDPFFGLATREMPVTRQLLTLPRQVLDCDILILRDVTEYDLARYGETLGYVEAKVSRRVRHPVDVATVQSGAAKFVLPELEVRNSQGPVEGLRESVRSLELYANLRRTGAIRQLARAHFRLPSGSHAASYVRVADALDSTTAVSRLADWFQHKVTADTVLFGDTWTLLPLLQELSYRMPYATAPQGSVLHRWQRLPVVTFSRYPTPQETRATLDRIQMYLAGSAMGRIEIVLSVVSSGEMLENLRLFMEERLLGIPYGLTALVNTEPQETAIDSHVRLTGIQRFAAHRGAECKLCLDPERRPIVRIDAKSYSEHVTVEAIPQMLRADRARPDKAFWELVDAQDALQLHVRDPILDRHMPIWLDVPRLLQDQDWKRTVLAQLRRVVALADLVVLPKNPSETALRDLVAKAYPEATVIVLDRATDNHAAMLSAPLATARNILILDDVLIEGATVRGFHRVVQDLKKQITDLSGNRDDYTISVFVVVARPEYMSVWEGVDDSLRQARAVTLGYGQMVLLPESHCPWCDEIGQWEILKSSAVFRKAIARSKKAHACIEERLDQMTIRNADTGQGLKRGLFLCDRDGSMARRDADRLTSNSVFGEGLREHVAYSAVVDAMQRTRDEIGRSLTARDGVAWFWNLTRIFNAYHDPLLHAAFLRAARAPELHVPEGRGVRSSLKTVMMRKRGKGLRQWAMLAAEDLLALAAGKYARARAEHVLQVCAPLLRGDIRQPLGLLLASAFDVSPSLSEFDPRRTRV